MFLTLQAMRVWHNELKSMLPPRCFPLLDIGVPAQQFTKLPKEIERDLIAMRVQDALLRDPDYERRWWKPLREYADRLPEGLPERLHVDFRWNGPGC